MSGRKAKKAFKSKGYNFMTPDVLFYLDAGDIGIEVSKGTGLNREIIYGVSVINLETGELLHDESDVYFTLEDAEKRVEELKGYAKV